MTEKSIVPDDLKPDYLNSSSIMNEDCKENKPAFPSKKSGVLLKGIKNKNMKFSLSDENLTPEDFIQLLEEDDKITNEFCYLKKVSHPYDLKII